LGRDRRIRSYYAQLALVLCEVVRTAPLERANVRGARVDALQPVTEVRARLFVDSCPRAGGLHGEAHLDVGRGELGASEPRSLADLALHEAEVRLELRRDEALPHLLHDALRDGTHEERHGRRLDAVEDQREE